ncbi:hypothetical protein [Amycolatopsis sp. YIM 10]|uniref:hypothetical protein n=1 Tax=Amycolatopsis sp. YIM 10 TaxID=2653857 RepID=UPI001D14EF1D|nr:hypothetical protein [Amycolatopsis sp. YIM 10]
MAGLPGRSRSPCSPGIPAPGELDAYAQAGVDRVIVTPWRSSRTAEEDLRAYAAHVALGG